VALLSKKGIKWVLGELPLSAELYMQVRHPGKPLSRSFSLKRLQEVLPEWQAQAEAARRRSLGSGQAGRRLLVFSTLRYWIEHAALLGLALAGLGHTVTLAYLPYGNWRKPMARFDLRRQSLYTRQVLALLMPLVRPLSLLDLPGGPQRAQNLLPASLEEAIELVSERDVQYTLQVEEVDKESELFKLRMKRNCHAARSLYGWLRSLPASQRPQAVLIPNGSILELGAAFQTVRILGLPAVTYEFGEQRQRIWLANEAEVMHQPTQDLWQSRKDLALSASQWEQVKSLYTSRQKASPWENFARRWQELPSQGGQQVRQALGLDSRPVVLLAANVIGDSLTLGRQVFSRSMTEWLQRSVSYFAGRNDVQLVVRVHPGERYTRGPSVADVVRAAQPEWPVHFHLVAAQDEVNTYDLVEVADLGLVYTTTVGLEMAMSGVPVIVAGQTHYRGKGFTHDPDTWEAYFRAIQQALATPRAFRMDQAQVELAWNYAYRFFFEYPLPFPWHLLYFMEEVKTWPIRRALSTEGQAAFGEAYRCLAGEPRNWGVGGRL